MDQVALEEVFLRVFFYFPPAIIIPLLPNIHLTASWGVWEPRAGSTVSHPCLVVQSWLHPWPSIGLDLTTLASAKGNVMQFLWTFPCTGWTDLSLCLRRFYTLILMSLRHRKLRGGRVTWGYGPIEWPCRMRPHKWRCSSSFQVVCHELPCLLPSTVIIW